MTFLSIAGGGAAKAMIAVTVSLHPAAAHHDHSTTVRAGDTLSSISKQEYGKAADWPAVWWANRHRVSDPGLLRTGQRLSLPDSHEIKTWLHRAAQAAPAPATAGSVTSTATASAPAAGTYSGASGSFQSCVIQAESGGDAGAVNASSGAGGLYGFLPSTWQALGFSGLPQDASVSEQNAAFAKEYAAGGSGAWAPYDGC
jgi:resuscitation-promoting factor RpfC